MAEGALRGIDARAHPRGGRPSGVMRVTPSRTRPQRGRVQPQQFIPLESARGTAAPEKVQAVFHINGERCETAFLSHRTLLEVLREELGLTGTKHGCELGECGTCTVLVDGLPVLSCLALAITHRERRIETVEGMAQGATLHPLQDAFAELGAAQCGYCTPGFLLAAQALLRAEPAPSRDRIRAALSGNLCRCTGYLKIYEAVELAAQRMAAASPVAR